MEKNNSHTKRKFSFNFIDIIIILIVLAVVALVVYIFISGNLASFGNSNIKNIEYKILVAGVRNEFKDKINIGDKITDSVKLMSIGEVIDVKYEDSRNFVSDTEKGELINAIYPEHSDIIITIQAHAKITDGFYVINGYQISVGTLVSLRVPNFTEQGYCTIINEVDN